ncbi:CotH kinase family protein [Arundinibacter roseus]|uniref:Spore coat protein CotH n=1 Tax=Arundinibacter roseus TaxID=2070510 RepID=A0A4R4KIT5_9BACT|nr:CotH kinase family protein [Arundinibacter roseus]TDB68088.1 spore coat protein CotH [Arundinibacter roseus]
MKKVFTLSIFILLIYSSIRAQTIVINELMASNSRTIADAAGDYSDWIELRNTTGNTINLSGYYITDNSNQPTKFQLPAGVSVSANGYLLLWANSTPERGPTHLSFGLSAGGEYVGLYAPDGSTLLDEISFGPQQPDISWGRQPDITGSWFFLTPATPGTSNASSTAYEGLLPAPEFSHTGGFYSASFSLTLRTSEPGATIYYTLDGSEPDPAHVNIQNYSYKNRYEQVPGQPNGPLLNSTYRTYMYENSLQVEDRSTQPNSLANHSSTYDHTPTYIPVSPIFKATVVRAKVVKPGFLSGPSVTHTFLVNSEGSARFSLPIVSVVTPPQKLFDYTNGVYNAGVTFDSWRAGNSTTSAWGTGFPGNFQRSGGEWEIPGNVEFLDDSNQEVIVNQSIGIRLHGGFTRGLPQKTLRLYSADYFDAPFFSGQSNGFHKRLILRNSGNDWGATMFKDAVYQQLVRHLSIDTQGYKPSLLLMNGEYWGIHNLRERYDKYYLFNKYQVDPDSVDLIENNYEVNEGDITHYNQTIDALIAGVQGADYENIKNRIDIENFIDYFISGIYISNTDWIENNIRCWRKKTTGVQPNTPYGHDGRWRWMLYDTDLGMITGPSHNGLAFATNADVNQYPHPARTFIFRRLLENATFREQFISRYADMLNTTFLPDRMTNGILAQKAVLEPEIQEHIDRWKKPASVTEWNNAIQVMLTFVAQRPAFARDHIRSTFGLSATHNLTVNVNSTEQGYVQVNTLDILPTTPGVSEAAYPWTGQYFQGVPVRLTAKGKAGYRFKNWKDGGAVLSTDTLLTLSLTSARSLLAEFEPDPDFVYDPVPFDLATCNYYFREWSAASAATANPESMRFVYMDEQDPQITAEIEGFTEGLFDYSSRSRVNGLGADGVSFINTTSNNASNFNPGYPMGKVGGALLGISTLGQSEVKVQWVGGTVEPNNREYALRLQYRIGESGPFVDVLDGANQPVEYVRNATAGHSQVMGPVALPAAALDRPYVQLFWRYYYRSGSGSRALLRLDDIVISRAVCQSVQSGSWHAASTWSCGRIPTSCDPVIIRDGHVVEVSAGNAEAQSLELSNSGHLNFELNRSLELTSVE